MDRPFVKDDLTQELQASLEAAFQRGARRTPRGQQLEGAAHVLPSLGTRTLQRTGWVGCTLCFST